MADRSDSSRRWLKEHFSDPYVKQAQQEGYRSRAVYKLMEINKRDRFIKPGMAIVDLGAAPGGWSQIATKLVHPNGKVFALDILPMEPIEGVDFILGDFGEDAIIEALMAKLGEQKIDVVLCDIAPNLSGHEGIDMPRSYYLSELALDFALRVLAEDGTFLIKVFQGEGFDAFWADIKRHFQKAAIRKPKASRSRSREVYILARGIKLR